MYRAKLLLRDPQRSLLDIALEVGYDTDTALSRAFKRAEGVPPGTWRRVTAGNGPGAEHLLAPA
jgi:AraC-like DNA-binding protein